MAVRRLQVQGFRCLESLDVELDNKCTLVYGDNASGKTSFLEAFAYLGRGRSFRGAPLTSIVRHGADNFLVRAELGEGGRRRGLAIQNGKDGLKTRLGALSDVGLAELAELLPIQIIDPEIHELVSGGPDTRRRFLDWIAFHVEHQFVVDWRDFRRALKQRNAALRASASGASLDAWDVQYAESALRIDVARRAAVAALAAVLAEESQILLGEAVETAYLSGWPEAETLIDALGESRDRDRREQSTQRGPHRSELRIRLSERQAKRLVSRGQQKLLASAMVIAACRVVKGAIDTPLVLLVDDLVAELDRESQRRLMARCVALDVQLVLTSLERDMIPVPAGTSVFHVEHGILRPEIVAEVPPADA